jgi:UDP-2,3-diacylglucosamine pyrophosphatase LpxH
MQPVSARVLVISDLHLGGAPASGDKPAFQMCTEKGRAALETFIGWAVKQKQADQVLHLVIAGDIIDFLAEEREGGFLPFTSDSEAACKKLQLVLSETAPIWNGLKKFLEVGSLTLLLGNHDLELSMPGPRRLLLDTLGPGRVEFLYDNQAFTLGPLLVEHGNRYDDWNAVPHDDLREVRSRQSRGETATFDPLPGSRMVVELVNPTKKELAFVDLLKPEDAALLPFLALLSPNRFNQVSLTLKNRVRALRVRYGAGQQPKDRNFVGLSDDAPLAAGVGTGDAEDDRLLALAEEAAAGGDPAMAGAGDQMSFFDRWKGAATDTYRSSLLDILLRTLQAYRSKSRAAFALDREDEKYLLGATESAAKGFKVIVYGHTHLPKKVSLRERKAVDGTQHDAVYLNSGTWADLMAVPDGVLDGDPKAKETRERLKQFADDLASNRVEPWRRQLPTFVDVTLNGAEVVAANVCLLDEQGTPVALTTEMIRERLAGGSK